MSKGRKELQIPRKATIVYLRIDLLAKLKLLLTDPVRDKVRYGGYTEYFEGLVERDLAERMRKEENKPCQDSGPEVEE